MRALVLERPAPLASGEPIRLGDVPEPKPGAGELLLRVGACAVCRTDLQLVEGDLPAHRLPTIPGHQVVGRVEAVGESVDRLVRGRPGGGRLARGHVRELPGLRGAVARTSAPKPASRPGTATAGLPSGSSSELTSRSGSPTGSTTRRPPPSCAAASSDTDRCWSPGSSREVAWASTAMARRPGSRSRSPATGDARCTSRRAPRASASGRSPLGRRPWEATTIPRRLRSTPPSRSPLPARSSWRRCARSTAAAPWPSTRSISTGSRPSTTRASGGSGACAASPTTTGTTPGAFLELAADDPDPDGDRALPPRGRRGGPASPRRGDPGRHGGPGPLIGPAPMPTRRPIACR